ncbi:unnamed protein product [Microthlaspi erraticum]|uniref:Uncharacterized protein n=1 Tax=Microthlaspi erraticum TaxID=1685480 RepID=A0A6D2KNP0_9BRAS|nr:unnamed protein product [Microthlaspi erraticum]
MIERINKGEIRRRWGRLKLYRKLVWEVEKESDSAVRISGKERSGEHRRNVHVNGRLKVLNASEGRRSEGVPKINWKIISESEYATWHSVAESCEVL